jgi:tetratricopeptide (TPR) repeat protein
MIARILQLEEGGDEKYKLALEKALAEFPRSYRTFDRRMKLASYHEARKQPELRKKELAAAIEAGKALASAPKLLEGRDLTVADVWANIAGAHDELENKEEARKAWKNAAREYKSQIKSPDERGYHLEYAACSWRAGDFETAERIYRKFEEKYPEEFTFYFGHAGMKLSQKSFAEAKALASKAFEHSYGDNRLRVAHLLARAIKGEGDARAARELVRKTLEKTTLPDDRTIRTHRYAKALQELEKQL